MRRREVLMIACAVLAISPSALSEERKGASKVSVITPSPSQWEPAAFAEGLRHLGYIEGQNLITAVYSADGKLDRLAALADEAVKSHPDVIVAVNTPGARAAIDATKTIPIVMAVVGDPVGQGFVESLARPGGNVTGVSNLSAELAAKRLSILKEIVPTASRIAILLNPNDPITAVQIEDVKKAAPVIGVGVDFFRARSAAELPAEFERLVQWHADAALWLSGQQAAMEELTISLAMKHKVPVMHIWKRYVEAGGLISYFANREGLFRQAAAYVDKILDGAKAADLPVEQPNKFELSINLKTAKAFGLTVPLTLLASADAIFE